MLGGKVAAAADGGASAAPGAPGAQRPDGSKLDRGRATGAMGVTEFMEKGLGGAQLPRKRQDRKEKEREKRSKGQSTHAEWKPEAWMVMRQQYDG